MHIEIKLSDGRVLKTRLPSNASISSSQLQVMLEIAKREGKIPECVVE